jgi:cytochrome c-type biogenesis protein CcmF
MLVHYGFFLILLCCILSAYGAIGSIFAARWRHRRLFRSAQMAATLVAIFSTIACALLWYFFFQRDFSVHYVYKTSSLDLPLMYTVTAFWSSLEGSHLLWTWLMAICAGICAWTYAKDNEHIMPHVLTVMMAVLAWMFYLALTHSDPFQALMPARPNGNGMNTLLQDPYMAIHPPLLFIGYTTIAVPFAYSLAALLYGDITEGWSRTVRRWTMVSWTCLTAALALGGRWAYVELGWAGYWAWDPVENSSFMPWIIATALLHSLLIQEKLGHLKRLSIVLAILGFFMTFMGTFITRSGMISSVHSFAESPIGPNYLIFLAALLSISLLIYGVRANSILPPDVEKVWGVSKESALIITQFLLLSFAAIVFIGTMFPLVSEAITGQKVSIQAPYFNAFAPYFGAAIMMAIGIGNIMHYQTSRIPDGKKILLGSALVAIPVAALLVHFGDVMRTTNRMALGSQIVGLFLASWTIACLSWDLVKRMKPFGARVLVFLSYNLAYFGAYLAHVGIIVCIIGFLGNYRGLEVDAPLKVGESAQLYGYSFTFHDGISIEQHDNAQAFVAPITVSKNGQFVTEMRPGQRRYPTSTEITNEIAVNSSLWYDMYIVLAGIDKTTGQMVTLKIHINPTVRFVWIGIVIMVLGGLIAVFDRRRGLKSRDAVAGQWELASGGVT